MTVHISFVTPALPPAHEPDLSQDLKDAVIAALREAWKELRATQLPLLRTGEEEAITHALERVLNEQDPSTGQRKIRYLDVFETVAREASVSSASGGYKKAPDLVFRPTASSGVRNRSDWGYWVEAKLIDLTHGTSLYIKQGVERFIAGDYAPRMPSGAMTAYVRTKKTPAASLKKGLPAVFVQGPSTDIGTSSHQRASLVTIVLTHLWLDAK